MPYSILIPASCWFALGAEYTCEYWYFEKITAVRSSQSTHNAIIINNVWSMYIAIHILWHIVSLLCLQLWCKLYSLSMNDTMGKQGQHPRHNLQWCWALSVNGRVSLSMNITSLGVYIHTNILSPWVGTLWHSSHMQFCGCWSPGETLWWGQLLQGLGWSREQQLVGTRLSSPMAESIRPPWSPLHMKQE